MYLAHKSYSKRTLVVVVIAGLLLTALVFTSCREKDTDGGAATGVSADVQAIAEARGLTPDDIVTVHPYDIVIRYTMDWSLRMEEELKKHPELAGWRK